MPLRSCLRVSEEEDSYFQVEKIRYDADDGVQGVIDRLDMDLVRDEEADRQTDCNP
jgi:hypothetical protein